MHELIKALFVVLFIVFVLFLGLLFTSGRNNFGLNRHKEMPINNEGFNPRTLLRIQKEADAEASEFFDNIEELRRDFA